MSVPQIIQPFDEHAELSDEIVFAMTEAQDAELSCWVITGPLADSSWQARWQESHHFRIGNDEVPETSLVRWEFFTDKASAVACVQWHALRAVLLAYKKLLEA